jgi:cytochrome c553
MKQQTILTLIVVLCLAAVIFIFFDSGKAINAQTTDVPKMPEVITLGKDAKLGTITFNHVKHNGGAYNLDKDRPIQCISCHHTAQPASELVKLPPLKTAWPADRTTTLTADLFAKDPKGAGVAACRDCHAREGQKPVLIPAIPEIKHESSTALISVTNMTAFHRTCAGCHAEVRKTFPASKGPIQTQCMMCHKKTA